MGQATYWSNLLIRPEAGRHPQEEEKENEGDKDSIWEAVPGDQKVVVAALFVEKLWITSENWNAHERVDSARHFGRLHR